MNKIISILLLLICTIQAQKIDYKKLLPLTQIRLIKFMNKDVLPHIIEIDEAKKFFKSAKAIKGKGTDVILVYKIKDDFDVKDKKKLSECLDYFNSLRTYFIEKNKDDKDLNGLLDNGFNIIYRLQYKDKIFRDIALVLKDKQ